METFIPPVVMYNVHSPLDLVDFDRVNIIKGNISARTQRPGDVVTQLLSSTSSYEIAGGALIDMERDGKYRQLFKCKKHKIPIPQWWGGNGMYSGILKKGRQYVIKSTTGARTNGKAIVDMQMLCDMKNYLSRNKLDGLSLKDKLVIKDKFIEQFGIHHPRAYNLDEKHLLFDSMHAGSYIIEEYIDIDKEYRVIYIDDEMKDPFIVMYRQGCQIGDDVEEDLYTVQTKTIPPMLLKAIHRLCKDVGFLTMSIDVYVDTRDCWGIFEYSAEYSSDSKELLDILPDRITNALLKRVRQVNPAVVAIEKMITTLNKKSDKPTPKTEKS